MNTITIELCTEDRVRLDKILEALTSHNCERCADAIAKFVAASVGPFEPVAAPENVGGELAEAEPETVNTFEGEKPVEAEKQPEAPAVSHADIQRKVVELSAAGKKAEVREVVTAYAKKVSDLPEDKLVEVWDKLNKLS